MDTYKNETSLSGIIFIIATLAGVSSGVFFDSLLDAKSNLTNINATENSLFIGAFLIFIMGIACATIIIPIYPALKKNNEMLALTAVVLRIIEGICFVFFSVIILTIISLGREYVDAGSPTDSFHHALGAILLAASDWTFIIGSGLVFALSALIYSYIFYRSKLLPRWLSLWIIIGAAIMIMDASFVMLGFYSTKNMLYPLLNAPLAIGEMVLAIWLIIKGFDTSALASI